MNLKREIIAVFHPYVKPGKVRPFRYRVISINSLPDYIPVARCTKEIEKFLNSGLDKDNFYVAKCGKVYMYRK